MSIGSKIKSLRKKSGLTQEELASGIITRGMLSRIENGSAMPSMQSLVLIAGKLEVSPSFLLEDGNDILPAELAKVASAIEKEYKTKNFDNCLKIFELWQLENEKKFSPFFVSCAFEVAISSFYSGDFIRSKTLLDKIEVLLPELTFPSATIRIERISFLRKLMDNIDSINEGVNFDFDHIDFEFSPSLFMSLLTLLKNGNIIECETILKYATLDDIYKSFLKAQSAIRDYKFIDAILEMKSLYAMNDTPLFIKLLCLSSMESCCKLCDDYKGAYENHLEYQKLLSEINR